MATTGKSSNKQPTGNDKDAAKQPASGPVLLSNPVKPEDVTVSRVPPSQPIESGLVGKSDGKIEPAAAKAPASKPETSGLPSPKNTSGKPASGQGKPAHAAEKGKVPPAVAPVTVRKTGFWPVALGGMVAAGLGAAAAIYATPYLPESLRVAGPQTDTGALKAEIVAAATDAARTEIGTLREDALVAAATAGTEAAQKAVAEAPQADGGSNITENDIAELKARIEAITAEVAALSQVPALDLPAGSSSDGADGTSPDLAAQVEVLHQQVVAQARALAVMSERPQVDPQLVEQLQGLAANADQVKAEIDAAAEHARTSLAEVQSEAAEATRRARTVASVAAIGSALERGNSPAAAVEQLKQAGVSVPEQLLQAELPTLTQLQGDFDAASRTALHEALKAHSQEGGAMNAIGNFLRVQTGARSIEPREGTDPDAILSRATALVEKGDLATTLQELDGLPQISKDAMAEWMAQASSYLAAEAALSDVAKSLN
ncbi:MAG: COG4223 family protein [Paracoccus sp. (in: a-proteobacteria)]